MGRLVSRRGVLVLRLRVPPSGFRGRVGGRGLCLGVHVRTGVTLGKRLRLISHLGGLLVRPDSRCKGGPTPVASAKATTRARSSREEP